jgi:hypothetical protein
MSVRLFSFDKVQVANLKYTPVQFNPCSRLYSGRKPIDRQYLTVHNTVTRNQPQVKQTVGYIIRENLPGPVYFEDVNNVKFTSTIVTVVEKSI